MKLKSIAAGAVLAGALVLGSGVAPAAAAYVGGGYWDWGLCQGGPCGTGGLVYSNYQHHSLWHKATACSNWGCYPSGWKSPGTLASGVGPMSLWGNTAYWGTAE